MQKFLILLQCCFLIACLSRGSTASDLFQGTLSKEVLTNADVIDLSKRGWSDSAIVHKIRCSQTNFSTDAEESRNLKSLGVSEVVIKAMRDSRQGRAMKCGEESSSTGMIGPRGPTGPVNSRPEQGLTPAQLKAQEEATRQANPSVPFSPGTTQPVPQPQNPAREPVTTAIKTSQAMKPSSPSKSRNRRRKKPRKLPRKKGDPT